MSKIQIHNVATGVIETRDMTSEEEAQLVKDKEAIKAYKDNHTAAEDKKKSGKDKLIGLGLTSDEVDALIGAMTS